MAQGKGETCNFYGCRTAGVQQEAAFSVARGTNDYPDRRSVIRFTKIITNINDDYNSVTGHFR